MPASAAPVRQTLTAMTPWQFAFRVALLLLFEIWHLTNDHITQICHALFPITHEYFFKKLRGRYKSRWPGGRREHHWRTLDRPNTFDSTPYTNQELLHSAAGVAHIVREANNLGIQLNLKVLATHQLLTYVPAGTAGVPLQAMAQSAAAAPAQTPATNSVRPTTATNARPTVTPTVPTTSGPVLPVVSPGFNPVPETLSMLHRRDVSIEKRGAYYYPHPDTIFGDQREIVDPASALYALGGPLYLVEDAPAVILRVAYRKALAMICNGTRCGVCNEGAPSVEKPVTSKLEDRLIGAEENRVWSFLHSSTAINYGSVALHEA